MSFGQYRIERELGRGGMGIVYLGVHVLLDRRAAIKVMARAGDREARERFFTEARAAAAIKHPNIVEIYELGTTPDDEAYLVMELLVGEPLVARVRRGRLAIPAALELARQIADGLAAAHRAGIVHRDLKPENVFLLEARGGATHVKLLDFGIAKLLTSAGDARLTATGALLGTPTYMSPEQCEGSRAIDHRSDLYSLGCVLFEMLTGRPPFEGAGLGGLIGKHLHVAPPRLRELRPEASPALEAVVARLLEKSPDARYPSAEAVLAALAAPEVAVVDAAATVRDAPPVVDRDRPTVVTHAARGDAPGAPSPASPRGGRRAWWVAAALATTGTIAVAAVVASTAADPTMADALPDGGRATDAMLVVAEVVDAPLVVHDAPPPDATVVVSPRPDPSPSPIVGQAPAGVRTQVRIVDDELTPLRRAAFRWDKSELAVALATAADRYPTRAIEAERIALEARNHARTRGLRDVIDLVIDKRCDRALVLARQIETFIGDEASRIVGVAQECNARTRDEVHYAEVVAERFIAGDLRGVLAECGGGEPPVSILKTCVMSACLVGDARRAKALVEHRRYGAGPALALCRSKGIDL